MAEWIAEEKQALIEAIQKIAANTEPKDTNLQEVSTERDKFKALLKGCAGSLLGYADQLNIAMDEPDFMLRSRDIRDVIQNMRNMGNSFKVDRT